MDKDLIHNEIEEFKEKIDLYKQGRMTLEDFKRRRLQQGIYAIRAQTDIQMVRVRLPSGRLTAEQLERLSDIAKGFANGIGHLTTREDMQFHWVGLEKVIDVISMLAEVGLTTREACGNTIRNITACPLVGVCPRELFDVSPYSLILNKFLVRNKLCQSLPRKFKIAFSGCAKDCSRTGIHDFGVLATKRNEEGSRKFGFKMLLGGGLGPLPYASAPLEEWTPIEELIPTCEAVVRLFDRLGERKNRSKARMKFLVASSGIESFRSLVFEEREKVKASGEKVSLPYPADEGKVSSVDTQTDDFKGYGSDDIEFQRWLKTNVISQKQKGSVTCVIRLIRGDITAEQMRIVAGCAKEFSPGDIRTDTEQNMLLVGVKKDDLKKVYECLRLAGLNKDGAYSAKDVVCCPGTDTCNLGIASSRGLALSIINLLEKEPHLEEALKDVHIKISGCPNSCSQHHIATLGFYGGARQMEGRLIPYYQFLFGGETGEGTANFGKPVIRLPAKRVPILLLRLVSLYKGGRNEAESFIDYFKRLSIEKLRQILIDMEKPLSFAKEPDEYFDWGKIEEFNLVGMGPGECAM